MPKQPLINIELMFKNLLTQGNVLIEKIATVDPASEAYGVMLNNLAKTFTILGGANVKGGDTDGDK